VERKRFPDKSHARRKAKEADRIVSLEDFVSILKPKLPKLTKYLQPSDLRGIM
jgi:hypothetical protein